MDNIAFKHKFGPFSYDTDVSREYILAHAHETKFYHRAKW